MADQGEVDHQLCKAGVLILRVAEFRTIHNSEVLLASANAGQEKDRDKEQTAANTVRTVA